MHSGKLKLMQIMAIILIIGLAVLSSLFRLSSEKAGKVDMTVPPPVASVTELDRPRPEVRIERVLKLGEFRDFDPDLAMLLKTPREWRISDDAPEGEQLASLSSEHGRVTNDHRALERDASVK
jgi:hypothetical protein